MKTKYLTLNYEKTKGRYVYNLFLSDEEMIESLAPLKTSEYFSVRARTVDKCIHVLEYRMLRVYEPLAMLKYYHEQLKEYADETERLMYESAQTALVRSLLNDVEKLMAILNEIERDMLLNKFELLQVEELNNDCD